MLYYEDIEVGVRHVSAEYVVDKDAMIAFAREWDPQPFHVDEEAARHYPTGLIGSSVQSYGLITRLSFSPEREQPAMVAGLGIDEWRMPNPLRPGDRVRAVSYVESKRESASKPQLGILVSVSQLINQHDEIILTYKSSGLVMKRPAAN